MERHTCLNTRCACLPWYGTSHAYMQPGIRVAHTHVRRIDTRHYTVSEGFRLATEHVHERVVAAGEYYDGHLPKVRNPSVLPCNRETEYAQLITRINLLCERVVCCIGHALVVSPPLMSVDVCHCAIETQHTWLVFLACGTHMPHRYRGGGWCRHMGRCHMSACVG